MGTNNKYVFMEIIFASKMGIRLKGSELDE